MQATLAAFTVKQDFPAGTTDPGFTFIVTGTQADGTAFTASQNSGAASVTFDLPPGTYTGTVSKLGVASQPSVPFTVAVPTVVTLEVPDPAQPATLGA